LLELLFFDAVRWTWIKMLEHHRTEFVIGDLAGAKSFNEQADRVRLAYRVGHFDHGGMGRDRRAGQGRKTSS
jgi:hypothetical protein